MEFMFFGAVAMAVLTGYIAERKGRAPLKWAVFGFFMPIVALIIVAVMDDYIHPRDRYRGRNE